MARKILIAENAPTMALFMNRTLTSAGYQVTVVHDAADAILLLERRKFDVLITDLAMPPADVGGEGLLQAARALCPSMRRLIVSGSERELEKGLAEARLLKPFSKNELLNIVCKKRGNQLVTPFLRASKN